MKGRHKMGMDDKFDYNKALLEMTYGKVRKLNNALYITDKSCDINMHDFDVVTSEESIINVQTGKIQETRIVHKIHRSEQQALDYKDGIVISNQFGIVYAKENNINDFRTFRIYNNDGKIIYGEYKDEALDITIHEQKISNTSMLILLDNKKSRMLTGILYNDTSNKPKVYKNIIETRIHYGSPVKVTLILNKCDHTEVVKI